MKSARSQDTGSRTGVRIVAQRRECCLVAGMRPARPYMSGRYKCDGRQPVAVKPRGAKLNRSKGKGRAAEGLVRE